MHIYIERYIFTYIYMVYIYIYRQNPTAKKITVFWARVFSPSGQEEGQESSEEGSEGQEEGRVGRGSCGLQAGFRV